MNVKPGAWLLVRSSRDSRPPRRAAILAVAGDGGPPYTVRWLDSGHEALVFPEPDAEVLTTAQQAELDSKPTQRFGAAAAKDRRP